MSAAAQNNPELTLRRHCQSFTLLDPYRYALIESAQDHRQWSNGRRKIAAKNFAGTLVGSIRKHEEQPSVAVFVRGAHAAVRGENKKRDLTRGAL
jgi:hypothetical protein